MVTNALFVVGMCGLAVGLYYLYVGASRAESGAATKKKSKSKRG